MRLVFAAPLPMLLAPMLALAACSPPAELDAGDAYVRLPAVKGNPAAAYFTLHGGAGDTTLMSVGSTVAIRGELHESMGKGAGGGGMASMKPLAEIPVPAASEIAFKPGGRHVMLFDMNPGIKPGALVPLVFQFSNGTRFERKARAIGAGDAPPED